MCIRDRDNGVPLKVFYSKRKSHLIKRDLWKNVKPVILRYANSSGNDTEIVDIVERLINEINALDKNGEMCIRDRSLSELSGK